MTLGHVRGRIGLYGEFGIGNAGNDESARTLIALLRERGADDLVAVTLNAPRTARVLGIDATQFTSSATRPRTGPLRIVAKALGKVGDLVRLTRAVRGLRAVIVVGTGLLEAPRGRYPGGDIIWLAMLSLACRVHRVPLFWFAIGGGRFGHAIPARVCVLAARMANRRSYRDALTRDSLAAHGLDVGADAVVADVVLAGRTRAHHQRETLTVVGLGPIDFPSDALDSSGGTYVERIARVIDALTARGVTVRLILADEADAAVADAVCAHLVAHTGSAVVPVVAGGPGFASLLDAVSDVDVVVGSRYHLLVAAVMAGVPVVALSHADKDDSLLADLDLTSWGRPITSFRPDDVVAMVEAAHTRRGDIAAAMESGRRRGADAVLRELDQILAALPGGEGSTS